MMEMGNETINKNSKSEFDELFEDEFFIIDSNNINTVNNKLYGYIIDETKIILNENEIGDNISGEGTYVYINVDENEISIHQDNSGCYGLYLFEKDNYFAISNSFLKLVEYLKHEHPLSLNYDYASSLIITMCSHISEETLVNEIKAIPRNYIIHINKIERTVNLESINYEQRHVPINSKEGLDILDNWFYRWTGIMRSIKAKTNNIQIDLSGGFDSRITFMLAACANIDLDKVKIVSLKGGNRESFKEDFEIASEIADEFNITLNNPNVINDKKILFKDKFTSLKLSSYIKLGFHNQMNFLFYKYEEPFYSFNGAFGGSIRELLNQTPEDFDLNYETRARRLDGNLIEPSLRIFNRTFEKLKTEFGINDIQSKELVDLIMNENRSKNHFGKLSAERFLGNQIRFSPTIDINLQKLKLTSDLTEDQNLLLAVMFTRYCPKLLDFKIQGNRSIKSETLEIAKQINQIKPFIPKEYEFISGPEINKDEILENKKVSPFFGHQTLNRYIKEIFYSRKFEMEFKKYFTDNLYNNISRNIESKTYFPLQNAIPTIAIMKIIDDIDFSQNKNDYTLDTWMGSLLDNPYNNNDGFEPKFRELLINYGIARIDIFNKGNENNKVEILETNDNFIEWAYPEWFKRKNGQGLTITSKKLTLDLKIKCINDGELNIYLRSKNMVDKKGNKFPIYIDYTNFAINGEDLLERNKLVNYVNNHKIKKEVKNSEILNLHIEWLPFNKESTYYDKVKTYKKKVNALTEELNVNKQKVDELNEEIEMNKQKQENQMHQIIDLELKIKKLELDIEMLKKDYRN